MVMKSCFGAENVMFNAETAVYLTVMTFLYSFIHKSITGAFKQEMNLPQDLVCNFCL